MTSLLSESLICLLIWGLFHAYTQWNLHRNWNTVYLKENVPVEQRCCLSSHLCLLSVGALLGTTSRNTRQMKKNWMSDWCLIAWVYNSIGSPEILNRIFSDTEPFIIFGFTPVSWMWLLFGYSYGSRLYVVNLNLQLLASGLEERSVVVVCVFLKQRNK